MKKKITFIALIAAVLMFTACNPVTTMQQLKALQSTALMYAGVVSFGAFFLAFIIATLIPYQGGTDRSYIARRVVYIVIAIMSFVSYFLFNFLYVRPCIKNAGFASQFDTTNVIGSVIILGVYVIAGLLVALCFRGSKFATVFFKPKKK